jgi:hypothetical protein
MGWSFDIQVSSADIINGLIVQHDGNVSMFQKGVSGQDRIVRLNNSSRDLRGWIDSESQFGFLSIINRKSFQKKGTKTRSSTTSDGIENQESLESSTVISEFSNSV